MKTIFNYAANFYHKKLLESTNSLKYLHNRGINLKTVKNQGLGFSDNQFEVVEYLKKEFTWEKIKQSRILLEKKDGSFVDRYYNYLVAPVFSRKIVSGFTARNMNGFGPKYLHSKGTFEYPYNIDVIFSEPEFLIFTEGVFDTLLLLQEDFPAIGVLGTSHFKKHFVKYFKDFKGKIYWLFDSDENKAGLTGALHSANVLYTEGNKDSKVCVLPEIEHLIKTDITNLFLHDEKNFKEKIKTSLEQSITYSRTKHYKQYLVNLEEKKEIEKQTKITGDFINYVRNIDMISFVERYLKVDRTRFGGKALCPFHEEKTPSLIFYRNSNKCFCMGQCNFQGDLIEFYKRYHNLTFKEAIDRLKVELNYKE